MAIIFFLSVFSICSIANGSPTFSHCLEDQKSLLLGLKNSLIFNSSVSQKLVRWNRSTDCCRWDGVECDVAGYVTSLQLDHETISSGIENSKYLIRLHYLEKLNLAYNNLNAIQIPKEIYKLTNLTHLNLSNAGFGGQVPGEILQMKKLVSLDLSPMYLGIYGLKLENPNLKMLVQNLTGLREFHLDGMDISAQGSEWCQVLSSSLPDLRILSLRDCRISGPIDSSLSGLRSLLVLRLDGNNLASSVPNSFANFSKLTTLSLRDCSLFGTFPEKIFQISSLQNLDLSQNKHLSGYLPQFSWNGSLRTIVLSETDFSGSLPDSISNLEMLSRLDLSYCSFSGPIPPTIANLTELAFLDLSINNFSGPIPLFHLSKKLTYIDTARNSLTGSVSSMHFEGLPNLLSINLKRNLLTGNIPPSLFALPSLQELQLSNNEFHGPIQELPNPSSSLLEILDFSFNHLEGPFPKSFSKLERLKVLSLSSNVFNGTLQLEIFKNLNLSKLDLSYNDLFIDANHINSSLPLFPWISELNLASCNLQKFPQLSRQSRLDYLDLSSNQLKGKIPNWIWEIVDESHPAYVNLSYNLLDGFQKPYKFPSIEVLALHHNQLQGELPILPSSSYYVDYSFNHFSNSIPNEIGILISDAVFFSISNNNLTGEIPKSICNARQLSVLDLSGNALTGTIPSCLDRINTLDVLRLGRNNLSGNIPNICGYGGLETLDLEKNVLEGKIPRSLVNCSSLQVFNIGNNMIEDTFPCMLMKNQGLRVLVLQSNQFYGDLQCFTANQGWPNLQIIDISNNNFGGDISLFSFSNWSRMITANGNERLSYMGFSFGLGDDSPHDYQDTVRVTMKGLQFELTQISNIFTAIDFSRNKFHGSIPSIVGDLQSLYVLNLSHNALTGAIPASIGNLTQLGSLDLSANNLTGKIPEELASLTFLSFLNLSFNKLFGLIPHGSQLQTFSADSYEGNAGLCGFPVTTSCNDDEGNGVSPPKKEIDMDYVCSAIGFAVGLASTVWLLLHYRRWGDIFSDRVDDILLKVFT